METAPGQEQKIIETARRIFVEKGFEQTNMCDIAAAAGINRTTLHYYFRTKDRMFEAVFGSLVESFLPRIETVISEEGPFIDRLGKVFDVYIALFLTHPSLPKFILGEVQRDMAHLLAVMRKLGFDKRLTRIKRIVQREMDEGRIRRIPFPVVLLTFYSQLTFPFLSRNLVTALFYPDERDFVRFMEQWKENVIRQMECLLLGPGKAG